MMFYEKELSLLRNTFKKSRIQTLLINKSNPLDNRIDMGLLQLLDNGITYEEYFQPVISSIKPNTIYKFTDSFSRRYIIFLLPDITDPTILVIGPYISKNFTREEIIEKAERVHASSPLISPMINYFGSLPIFGESSDLFSLLDSFAEILWHGAENFTVALLGKENITPVIVNRNPQKQSSDPKKTVWNMQLMEDRYSFENELMQAVTNGQIHKTELILSKLSNFNFARRLSDPLREFKNYCIIMNTLLRKAAENGGVHPIYLDSTSSEFAIKIEKLSTIQEIESFVTDMFRSYCRLVKNCSTRHYSPIIQRITAIVDYDITANLSLNALAAMLNINASYLSSRFKSEVGLTLTDYVNQKRITHAKHLLKTTNLQIQTVAQYCGITDLHYFSKLFKRYTDKTPKEYRESEKFNG